MSALAQNILVAILVLACAAFVLVQSIRTLRGRGKVGSCCARGCEPATSNDTPKTSARRIVFMPAENLRIRR